MVLGVATELVARRWIRWKGEYFVLPPGLRQHLKIDAEVFPELQRDVHFDVNREGERGDEVPRQTAGLYRVLVGGGSQPEGFLLDQHTAWPGALQRILERPDALLRLGARRVHVGSIARSGVGSEALDLIFERVLPRYPQLSTIIVLVGVSDVLHWLEEGAPPRPPSPPSVTETFRCHPEGPYGWTPGTLAIGELMRRVRRQWFRPVDVHMRTGRWYKRAAAMRARAKEIRHSTPDPSPMLDHFEYHFRRLLQRASAQADHVLVVHQPWLDKEFTPKETERMWHGGVGQVWRQEVTAYYSFEVVSHLITLLEMRAARVANELRLQHLNLMPLLDQSLETYYDCFHLTPSGAMTVARAIADALLSRQHMLSSPTRPSEPLAATR
jgi:lysophospholipase L1-like esterase